MNCQPTNQNEAEFEQNKPLNPFPPSTTKVNPPSIWCSKRLLVTVLMFLCYINTAFIRCNISIAVVDMTSPKLMTPGNSTEKKRAEFDWDPKTVGFILSVFFYGGLASLGGGYVVTKLGGAFSCWSSLMLCGIIMILHPISLEISFYLFLLCRLLIGIFESFMIVSVTQLCSKWIPKNEKSKLMSFVVTGLNVGVGVVHVSTAFLATKWGWPMIFYATGALSLITSLLCFFFLKNQPSEDKSISRKELTYIQDGTATVSCNEKVVHPYKQILSSAPVWAFLISQFAYMWILTILMTLLPLYIKDFTEYDTNTVGQISSLTNIVNIFMLPIYGILLGYTKNFDISTTKMHKILLSGACIVISILFIGIVRISNFTMAVISFIVIQMLISIPTLILSILGISIVPNSSSVIAALGMFTNAVSSILSRSITGFMTMNHSIEEWNRCFILASGISFLGAVIFIFYGSSEPQSWPTSPTARKNYGDPETDRLERS